MKLQAQSTYTLEIDQRELRTLVLALDQLVKRSGNATAARMLDPLRDLIAPDEP